MVCHTALGEMLGLGLNFLIERAAAGPAKNIGGIDMNAACREQHGSWYSANADFNGCSG